MYSTNTKRFLSILLIGAALASCKKETSPVVEQENETLAAKQSPPTATMTLFASGFNDPRGLEFGPDGNLYVAEAGTGGVTSSAGFGCVQAPAPFGPYFGSTTGGRVSRVNGAGVRTTVTSDLPSALSSIDDHLGPTDIAFIGADMYVLVNGGCSHGVPTRPAGVYRVGSSGPPTLVANLSTWLAANPAAHPEDEDFEPDGSLYSMISVGPNLYVVEANHGQLIKVTQNGAISLVVDFSATQGHMVPTAIDYHGNFYVGNLGTFPISGQSKIWKVTPSGNLHEEAAGLSTVLGLVIDKNNWTYVLEMTQGAAFPTPGKGRIVAISPSGDQSVLIGGLNFPTGMTQGPDGNLFVSQWGFGLPPGGGQVLKISLQ